MAETAAASPIAKAQPWKKWFSPDQDGINGAPLRAIEQYDGQQNGGGRDGIPATEFDLFNS